MSAAHDASGQIRMRIDADEIGHRIIIERDEDSYYMPSPVYAGASFTAIVAAAVTAAQTAKTDWRGNLYWPDAASAGHALAAARKAAATLS